MKKIIMIIGIIIMFVGLNLVPNISVNIEEKNKTEIDIDPTLNDYAMKGSFINNNTNNKKNEKLRDTRSTIFNEGYFKGWSITEVVSTVSTEDSWRPSLMVDSGGVVHVAWYDHTDYGGSGSDFDIFYKYKSDGGSWSVTEVVSTESIEDSWKPSLMVDSGGVVHVTWMDNTDYGGSGSDFDIFYKYKSGGGSWSVTEVVSTESTEDCYSPSLMVDSSGVVHAAWFDLTDYGGSGSDVDIFYKYKSGGGSWSVTEVVSTESTEDSFNPSLMVDSSGLVHVAWHDHTDYGGSGSDPDIFYKYKSGGGSWSVTEVVSTESTYDCGYPSIMIDNGSVVHVAWQDHTDYSGAGGDWDIFYKYKSGGGSWSVTEVVSTESGYLSEFPSLMVDNGGVVHVAWMDKSNYGGSGIDLDIFYKYKTNGISWSNTEVVSTESTAYSYYTSLYADNNDTVHVTWYDYTEYGGSGSDADIFYKYKSSENRPPLAPEIDGETNGDVGTEYDYEFNNCVDPDGDDMTYHVEWDDGGVDEGFVASGGGFTLTHSWDATSDYTIKAKLIDEYGAESDWATFKVTMPRNILFPNTFILRLLERFPNAFPIIRQLLGL